MGWNVKSSVPDTGALTGAVWPKAIDTLVWLFAGVGRPVSVKLGVYVTSSEQDVSLV
jgi:hypothetical protein